MLKNSLRLSEMPFLSSGLSCRQEIRLVGGAASLPLPGELCGQQQSAGGSPLLRVRVVGGGDGIGSPSLPLSASVQDNWFAGCPGTHVRMRVLWPSVGCAVSALHVFLPHCHFLLATGQVGGIAALAAALLPCLPQPTALGGNLCFRLLEPSITMQSQTSCVS